MWNPKTLDNFNTNSLGGIKNHNHSTGTTNNSIDITIPTVDVGNLLVMSVTISDSTDDMNSIDGWDLLSSNIEGNPDDTIYKVNIYKRIADGTETNTITISAINNSDLSVYLASYDGGS